MRRIQERRVFPSGDFAARPVLGVRPRPRLVTFDRAACAVIGIFVGIVLEAMVR